MSKSDNRMLSHEESPSSVGQGCWITPSRGNPKDSATEIYRLFYQVRLERRGKSSPAAR